MCEVPPQAMLLAFERSDAPAHGWLAFLMGPLAPLIGHGFETNWMEVHQNTC